MVMVKEQFPRLSAGDINLDLWLEKTFENYNSQSIAIIQDTAEFARFTFTDNATFYGQPCFEQGLECAEILSKLNADALTISAGIIYCSMQGAEIDFEDLQENLNNKKIIKLAKKIDAMKPINTLHEKTNKASGQQIDNLRKMLLAMVQDVRTVLVVLARRLCVMRGVQILGHAERKKYSKETMEVYAPLANRLGLSELKWELEDLSFHDLEPEIYKSLGKALKERRADREIRVSNAIELLISKLAELNIKSEVTGRAKHLYSIYKKMQRKSVPFEEVYDTHAVRIIVDTVDECYKALGLVHDHWKPITEEFDDYISTPKPNGYQSIHTAVIDQDGKYLEIQIRTHQMHQENELGVAAHWIYKESGGSNNNSSSDKESGHEAKVAWLRELLDWHKTIGHDENNQESRENLEAVEEFHDRVFEERIYVFTPNGDIIDLAENSTSLDFAYHIHSEIGHRCRGAKINGKLVALTHKLQTGDNVEVVTTKDPHPSRDWLNPDLGYLSTPKARAKVHQWFRRQDAEKNIAEGRQIIEKELQKIGNPEVSLEKLANSLNAKNIDLMFAGIACGNLKISQLLHSIKQLYPQIKLPEKNEKSAYTDYKAKPDFLTHNSSNISIQGVSNLLTHIAHCCNPLPGENILGYITQGKGVSIHKADCKNIKKLAHDEKTNARILDAHWENIDKQHHTVELVIETEEPDKPKQTIQALTSLLTQQKVQALQIEASFKTKANTNLINCALRIENIENLTKLIDKIQQIPSVIEVRRS